MQQEQNEQNLFDQLNTYANEQSPPRNMIKVQQLDMFNSLSKNEDSLAQATFYNNNYDSNHMVQDDQSEGIQENKDAENAFFAEREQFL